jgi:hypothetical protein
MGTLICLEEFLEWETLRRRFIEKIKRSILWAKIFFPEKDAVCEKCGKICTARQDKDGNIIQHIHFAYGKTTARTDTHTHTFTEYLISIAFPRQQLLSERSTVLSYA